MIFCCKGCCFDTCCGGGVYFERHMHKGYFCEAKKEKVVCSSLEPPFLSPACYTRCLKETSDALWDWEKLHCLVTLKSSNFQLSQRLMADTGGEKKKDY